MQPGLAGGCLSSAASFLYSACGFVLQETLEVASSQRRPCPRLSLSLCRMQPDPVPLWLQPSSPRRIQGGGAIAEGRAPHPGHGDCLFVGWSWQCGSEEENKLSHCRNKTTVKQIEDAFKEFFILYAVLRSLPYVMKSADC